MATEYVRFDGKSKFLVKISRSVGFKTRRQRVELDRLRDAERDLRKIIHSDSASQFLRDQETE